MKPEIVLPEGLEFHCSSCKIVIPSDSPRTPTDSCGLVASAKLTWFDPTATVAAQHAMAVGAWALIHHGALSDKHPESVAYSEHFATNRKGHFAQSVSRKAMTQEQIERDKAHPRYGRRDGVFYEEVKEIDGNERS